MENYIVRIYRRDETDTNKVVGTLESVEKQTQETFKTLGRLVDLLTPTSNAQSPKDESNKNEPAQTHAAATLSD